MKLSALIEETLSEIALGVKAAKEKSRGVMAITPGTLDDRFVAEITYIEFDVSVVVSESSDSSSSAEKGAGGELRVLSIGASAKIVGKTEDKAGSSSQLTHRIAFKVPVCMAAEFTLK